MLAVFRPGYVPANTVIAAAGKVAAIAGAVQTMAAGTNDGRKRQRIHAALMMVLAAPEFLVQR